MKRILVMLFCIMCFSSIAFAKTDEWKDKTYDFSRIKRIVFVGPFISKEVSAQFALQKSSEILAEELSSRKIQVIFVKQLSDAIAKDTNQDMDELYKTDYNKWINTLASNAYKYVDAVMILHVNQMGYTQQYEEARTISYESYSTSTFDIRNLSGENVHGTITSPQTKYVHVPGGYRDYTTGAASAALYDPSSFKLIWGYSDVRSRIVKPLNNTTPDAMLKRIIKDLFDKAPIQQQK